MMVNSLSYPYVQKNLLDERYHYQYTPYEGPGLLEAYVAHRQDLRANLTASREKLLADPTMDIAMGEEIRQAVLGNWMDTGSAPLRSRQRQVLPARPGDADFITRALLLDLWQCCVYDKGFSAVVCSQWTDFLLQRFEVTKRLHAAYTSSLKPADRDYKCTDNYALLAALLIYRYRADPNLKYLNTVLKLNDLLASAGYHQHTTLTQLVTLAAVETELAALHLLMAEHQVNR